MYCLSIKTWRLGSSRSMAAGFPRRFSSDPWRSRAGCSPCAGVYPGSRGAKARSSSMHRYSKTRFGDSCSHPRRRAVSEALEGGRDSALKRRAGPRKSQSRDRLDPSDARDGSSLQVLFLPRDEERASGRGAWRESTDAGLKPPGRGSPFPRLLSRLFSR